MASKIVLALCLLIAVASSIPQTGAGFGGGGWGGAGWGAGGVNPWMPPWVSSAPWMPQWTACTAIGSSCVDCNTKLVCTKIGGLVRACTDPTMPYCNLGECSATPTEECAPPAEETS